MLKYLHIENIAVIESCDIEFTDGFNVLTGETGAGKSIIIDSINAVLGERTSKDLIRAGCDSAEVSALFGDFPQDIISSFREYDVTPDEDGNILITRKLSLSGKGLIKINGKPATASVLKEIAVFLVNIHGQHDNQALLNPEKHCDFIDAVAENSPLKEEYYGEFKNLNRIRKELKALEIDEDEKQYKIGLLKFQIKELEEADIKVGEIEALKSKLEIAENYEKHLKAFMLARQLFSGDDENDGILTKLDIAQKALSGINGTEAQRAFEDINVIISKAEDVFANIESFLDNADYSEQTVDEINQRLDMLYRLMHKYGNSEEKMLDFLKGAKTELENITFSDKRAAELAAELETAKQNLISAGKRLSDSRKKAGKELAKKVCEVLEYLNMSGVRFVADIKEGRYTKNGCDEAEFLISANAGEDLKPLHKIASGGELSRIMLAIKSSLLGADPVGTLIFDEIDAGISGYAADKVGTQLKKVSKNRQVICITHLAQIAARANTHLLIEKRVENGRTKTRVTSLDREARIREIARIMSGTDLTENLYKSAEELLDRSKE
ncbi:MAG: DNA repair protein RecN [Acutalibacteraceae bacterium]|jgi:DNA repair protein RecN (Recombination protein N)